MQKKTTEIDCSLTKIWEERGEVVIKGGGAEKEEGAVELLTVSSILHTGATPSKEGSQAPPSMNSTPPLTQRPPPSVVVGMRWVVSKIMLAPIPKLVEVR